MTLTGTRFLAREKELDVLRRRVADAVAGRGGLVTMSGPVGVGTTRLAREAADRALTAGMVVAWGECRAGLLDRPFGALAEALETSALGMPADKALADLAGDAGPLLRICPGLASSLPTLIPAVPLDPVEERLRLADALYGWLTRMAARAPLLVVLDEYQLADGDLRDIVDRLGRRLRGERVLLLTVSSAEIKKRKRATKPVGVLDAMELEGLDVGATAALIGMASERPVQPATIELIQSVGDGNPLMSVELYRHLVEESLLPVPGGGKLPALDALPGTIADLVAWRVARLPAQNRAALNVLAAFPRGASPNIVATVAGVIRGRAVEALDGLVDDGLVSVNSDGTRYEVIHQHPRSALLDAMPSDLRAQLHRRIAEVLEAEAGNERRQAAGELAHYWFESRTIPGRERGLGHFLLTAEQARSAYAHHRTVDCLRAALSVAPPDNATSFDLMARLALAQASAGLRKEALASAATALELGPAATPAHAADRAAPSSEAVAAVTDTLRTLRADGMDGQPATELDTLRESALESLGADRSARSDSLPHARLNLLAESWQELDLGGVSVLAWSDLQPPAASILMALGSEVDKSEVSLLQRPRSRAETAAAAESAGTWRRPAATLRAVAATASDLVGRLGLVDEGFGWATQYLATAERYGSVRDRVRALALLARCHAARGEFAAAGERCDQADALVPALAGAPSPSAEMLADEVLVARFSLAYFVDSDWRGMLKSAAPSKKPRPAGLLIAALRCIALKRLDKATEAGALLERLLPALTEVPGLTLHRDAALIETLVAVWEIGAAEHANTGLTLLALARNAGIGGQAEASLDLVDARLLGMAGRVPQSRTSFAAARSSAAAAGLLPQVAMADYDEAIVLAAAGARYYGEALNLLSAAGEKFERLGMRGWSDRVSALTLFNLKDAAAPGGRLFFTYPRGLSRREADIVRLSATGLKPGEVAAELELKKDEVDRAVTSALRKLNGKSVDELPQLARKYGLGGL